MPTITALLHTDNDVLRLGRCLETLYPCDQIVVVDHGSRDGTVDLAREYGARVVAAQHGDALDRVQAAGWLFCLDPRESLTESLAASVYEWKSQPNDALRGSAFSVFLRQETPQGWIEVPAAQTRIVPREWQRWSGKLPADDPSAVALEGELLRFVFP